MRKKSTRKISLQSTDPLTVFFKDQNDKSQEYLSTTLAKHGVEVKINNIGMLVVKCPQESSTQIKENFINLNKSGKKINFKDVIAACSGEIEGDTDLSKVNWSDFTLRHEKNNTTRVKPKTVNQQVLIDEIVEKKIIFANGPAGSGKTFIALAVACKYLEAGLISKIIITRPAVTTEDFGFLPGTIDDKMGPFLYPIFDILSQLIGDNKRNNFSEKGIIEILPVAFGRGITIGSSFKPTIGIIDEAQNLTYKQLKMMITRLGDHENSKLIFSGDISQSDLRRNNALDFSEVQDVLRKNRFIGDVTFTADDVVRSEAVKEMLKLFEAHEDKKNGTGKKVGFKE